ncbi:hypothetical protein B0H10DRAFT_1943312 [Mycena sp. CBHHK59/15]|nr:hypothetical protein B0H10DRAFT_1943312 [Mycena sp. CBHHK59/15]
MCSPGFTQQGACRHSMSNNHAIRRVLEPTRDAAQPQTSDLRNIQASPRTSVKSFCLYHFCCSVGATPVVFTSFPWNCIRGHKSIQYLSNRRSDYVINPQNLNHAFPRSTNLVNYLNSQSLACQVASHQIPLITSCTHSKYVPTLYKHVVPAGLRRSMAKFTTPGQNTHLINGSHGTAHCTYHIHLLAVLQVHPPAPKCTQSGDITLHHLRRRPSTCGWQHQGPMSPAWRVLGTIDNAHQAPLTVTLPIPHARKLSGGMLAHVQALSSDDNGDPTQRQLASHEHGAHSRQVRIRVGEVGSSAKCKVHPRPAARSVVGSPAGCVMGDQVMLCGVFASGSQGGGGDSGMGQMRDAVMDTGAGIVDTQHFNRCRQHTGKNTGLGLMRVGGIVSMNRQRKECVVDVGNMRENGVDWAEMVASHTPVVSQLPDREIHPQTAHRKCGGREEEGEGGNEGRAENEGGHTVNHVQCAVGVTTVHSHCTQLQLPQPQSIFRVVLWADAHLHKDLSTKQSVLLRTMQGRCESSWVSVDFSGRRSASMNIAGPHTTTTQPSESSVRLPVLIGDSSSRFASDTIRFEAWILGMNQHARV